MGAGGSQAIALDLLAPAAIASLSDAWCGGAERDDLERKDARHGYLWLCDSDDRSGEVKGCAELLIRLEAEGFG